jgi:hypothetical protein
VTPVLGLWPCPKAAARCGLVGYLHKSTWHAPDRSGLAGAPARARHAARRRALLAAKAGSPRHACSK